MIVHLTDDRGSLLLRVPEPEPGSVLLTEGVHGTAWQRHFADGLWHSTRGGSPKRWADLLKKRNVALVYNAAVRQDAEKTERVLSWKR